jgi:hypothetical protein
MLLDCFALLMTQLDVKINVSKNCLVNAPTTVMGIINCISFGKQSNEVYED